MIYLRYIYKKKKEKKKRNLFISAEHVFSAIWICKTVSVVFEWIIWNRHAAFAMEKHFTQITPEAFYFVHNLLSHWAYALLLHLLARISTWGPAHPGGYKGLPARRIYGPSYIMAYTLNVYTSAVIFLISVENISRIGQTRSNVYYSSSPSLWQRQVPCGKSRGTIKLLFSYFHNN